MTDTDLDRLPETVRARIDGTRTRVEALVDEARSLLRGRLPGKVSFELPDDAGPHLTSTERAQLITLIQRYAQLADPPPLEVKRRPDRHSIANLATLRQVLTDYRPFIHGSGASLHYARLHTAWSRRLSAEGGPHGLSVRVLDEAGAEITPDYRRWLGDRRKAIAHVVGEMDYDYVYDGVLQHERPEHSDRFLREYESGEIQHTLWAHLLPLAFIRQMLWPYQRLARAVTLPEMGGL